MDITKTTARNVKAAREKRQLTLDAAAALTGVSRSMLAQIEKGDVNPTISILWKIAKGYKISFSSLLEDAVQQDTVVACSAPVTEDDQGLVLNYTTFPFDDRKLFEMYRVVIKAGGFLQAEPHLAASEEFVTVFQGAAEITAGGQTHRLSLGDSLRFRADQAHSYRNTGDGDAVLSLLIAYSE